MLGTDMPRYKNLVSFYNPMEKNCTTNVCTGVLLQVSTVETNRRYSSSEEFSHSSVGCRLVLDFDRRTV